MSLGRAGWDMERDPPCQIRADNTCSKLGWRCYCTEQVVCGQLWLCSPANPLLHPHPVQLQMKHFPQPDSAGSTGSFIHLTCAHRLPLQIHHPKMDRTWPLHISIPNCPGVHTQPTTEPCCSLGKVSLPAFQGGGSSVT